ncbi:hypothetical protein [Butyrivibrio sp. AD3002]|uniref:hypothetical protein n=1 Tax=Butyrivibrio sp. AD3002 TaxID=1280670 RepID=UPI0003B714E2|nr:hypothetical protein [Butyrivibrio sp. AD3002]
MFSPLSIIIIVAFVGLFAILYLVIALPAARKRDQLYNYEDVTLGMREEEMLDIMGDGYNKSLLKDNRTKYEWRINAHSQSSGGVTEYSGVSKVTIYCKDGVVEEVRPYNIEY